jgi:hypothetical protein
MTSLATILPSYARADLTKRLRAYLVAAKCPVTDWNPGAFIRTLMEQWRGALEDYVGIDDANGPKAREQLVAAVLPILAAIKTASASDSLTLVAEQFFDVRRNFATKTLVQFAALPTLQNLTLTCDSTHGPYSPAAGSLWARNPVTGNRYCNVAGGTIPSNGSVVLSFRAEAVNDSSRGINYADEAGSIVVLDTPLPGVTCSNVAPSFSNVLTTPSPTVGRGTMSVGGSPPASATGYDVVITLSGQVGAATFKYRANGGAWSSDQTVVASFVIPSGPTLTFANDGGGADPSFYKGERYSFASPGTPITQPGVEAEADGPLLERCFARWPDLDGDGLEMHEAWARAASTLVNRVDVRRTAIPGVLDVTIAGQVNPLAGGVVTAAQLYIDQREGIGKRSVVAAAAVTPITATGVATVRKKDLAAVQAAAEVAWEAYINSDSIGGLVLLSKLIEIIMDAGAIDFQIPELNGSGANYALAAAHIPSPVSLTDPTSIFWSEV